MPPIRRKPSTRAQSTLAFGPNSTSNKVTKPLPPSTTTKKSPKSSSKSSALIDEISTPSPAPEEEAEEEKRSRAEDVVESPRTLAIRNQGSVPEEKKAKEESKRSGADAVEERARKIPETQIRKYWKSKEDERIAPRVHQTGLSVNEKILRHFDLSSQYGPCIGIPRIRRWKRAEGLGLKPPIEVLAVLVREEGRGNRGAERAFMDGLLASRLSGGD